MHQRAALLITMGNVGGMGVYRGMYLLCRASALWK